MSAQQVPISVDPPTLAGRFAGLDLGARLPRGRVRTLLWVALGAAALYVLVPQLGGLRESLGSLSGVNPLWVLAGLGLVAFRYAMAVVSLKVVVNRPIPFAPTLSVQLASSFVGRLTPESVGWLVLNQRYLERSGVPRASALAAITVKLLAGGLVRLLIAAGVAASVGASGGLRLDLPPATPYLLSITLVGATGALVLAVRSPRLRAQVVSGVRDLATVLRQPRQAAALLVSTAALTISYGLVLSTSLVALGIEVSVVHVFAVYLGGSAIAALSPTPGNIGAVELALTAGLTAIGVPAESALASTLLYRLLTFWMPIVPGFLAFRYLQTKELL
jgi:glycosyltransferase 2 family protein